jgi:hypothetical protein
LTGLSPPRIETSFPDLVGQDVSWVRHRVKSYIEPEWT